ncbi:MAG: enolase C-terminal domain-like protein [Bacteroidota bacterium]
MYTQPMNMTQRPLIITDYHWTIARLPFTQSVGHALKTRSCTQSIIFRVTDEAGRYGYGEGAPRTYVTQESIDDIGEKLEQLLASFPLPVVRSLRDIEGYSRQLLAATDYPSLVCAIETALLDLFGQQRELHLNALLGQDDSHTPIYSMVLPFMPLEKAMTYVAYVNKLRLPHLKIKLGFADDLDFAEALLSELHPACSVRIDANRAWTFAEATEKCRALQALGIHFVEEPLRSDCIDQLPALSREVTSCLGLDESLYTLDHARHYQQVMAPGRVYFNLKLSKCGGYLHTRQLWSYARAHGIPCQLGCNVGETAILSALGRAFAQQHELLFLEGSFNDLLLQEDFTTPKMFFGTNGKAERLQLPGLGIPLQHDHPYLLL